MSITFYQAPMSSATPVTWALAELDLPHEKVTFDLSAGEQRKPEFLALNPNGKVPTLVVDGAPMFEGLAIMLWLGERHGTERGLWPGVDDPLRMRAMSWSTWAYVTCNAVLRRYFFASSERLPKEFHNAAVAKQALEELDGLFGILDGAIGEGPFLLGASFSLADVIVGSFVWFASFSGVPLDGHERVKAWLARIQARPAYAKSFSAR